jgi:rare lipoprotein A
MHPALERTVIMKRARLPSHLILALIGLLCSAISCAAVAAQQGPATQGAAAADSPSRSGAVSDRRETGLAAVYSDKLHGKKTASGERYDRNALTAAHKTLPFGTQVKVTNDKNKKSVTLRINDRGPTQAGRILDISPRAAKALGIKPTAMAEVTAEVVGDPAPKKKK